MSAPDFVVVKADDWEMLFVNGSLVEQHHSVQEKLLEMVVEAAGVSYESVWLNADGERSLRETGWFEGNSLTEALELGVDT